MRLRTRLPTTCPTSTVGACTGIVRKRLTVPVVTSRLTETAVVAAPNPAHSRMIPGVT